MTDTELMLEHNKKFNAALKGMLESATWTSDALTMWTRCDSIAELHRRGHYATAAALCETLCDDLMRTGLGGRAFAAGLRNAWEAAREMQRNYQRVAERKESLTGLNERKDNDRQP